MNEHKGDTTADGLSLGIVQRAPTQFDDPFYRYLARETDLKFTVHYYSARTTAKGKMDLEIGRKVGWSTTSDCGYDAVFDPCRPLEFARQVVRKKYDLIIISGYSHHHALYTALLARKNGIPVGLRSDNILPGNGGRLHNWLIKSLAYPVLFRLYTTAHPVGRQAGEYLKRFGFKGESLFIFPYAVDHQWFARESSQLRADQGQLRTSWGLPVEGQVVCAVLKFSEREDPLTLVRAFKEAKRKIPNLALLLIGDGPLRKQVEECAGEYLGTSIILPGYLNYSMLPSTYAASDLFVHPAKGPWEVSVNEALACGLPVIASDEVGSAYELILPDSFGYTFRHADSSDLANRIVAALNDPELISRTRTLGIQSLEKWGYAATAERLKSALQFARNSA